MASEPVTPQYPDPTRVVNKSISLEKANLYGLFLSPPLLALILIPFALRWGWQALFRWRSELDLSPVTVLLIFVVLFLISIVVHELLHAVGWAMAGGVGWKAIEFGVKSLTPYAHAMKMMSARGYRIGAALPGVVLGVIPGLVGILTGVGWLALYGALMLISAVGDVMVLWLLWGVPGDAMVLDHPSEAGCQVVLS